MIRSATLTHFAASVKNSPLTFSPIGAPVPAFTARSFARNAPRSPRCQLTVFPSLGDTSPRRLSTSAAISSTMSSSSSQSVSELRLPPSVQANNPTLATLMRAMDRFAPLPLADRSWDNVGLLLEAPSPRKGAGVHLCIDLTTAVCDEALSDSEVSTVLCYHPIIFRGLKSLTMADPQQASLLRCVAAGISVYSPHTSLDATSGGINDWLAEGIAGGGHGQLRAGKDGRADLTPAMNFASPPEPLTPSPWTASSRARAEAYPNAGMGRKFTLAQGGITLPSLVARVKTLLKVSHVQVALPQGWENATEARKFERFAVCAGSGSSVLSAAKDSQCWVTGEMSHHELLAATAAGRVVVLANHSNSERGYLADVLKPRLEALTQLHGSELELGQTQGQGGTDVRLRVTVSAADRDPLIVM